MTRPIAMSERIKKVSKNACREVFGSLKTRKINPAGA
jgi:hypothetical protein